MNNFYIRTREHQFGPLNLDDIKDLINDKFFSPQDQIWNFKSNIWEELSSLAEFRQFFSEKDLIDSEPEPIEDKGESAAREPDRISAVDSNASTESPAAEIESETSAQPDETGYDRSNTFQFADSKPNAEKPEKAVASSYTSESEPAAYSAEPPAITFKSRSFSEQKAETPNSAEHVQPLTDEQIDWATSLWTPNDEESSAEPAQTAVTSGQDGDETEHPPVNIAASRTRIEREGERAEPPKIIAIASGKGGVGKTALAASLAVELGSMGKKVVVVDADFGGPDLHEWMGLSRPPLTLKSYFYNKNICLDNVILPTDHANVDIICGEIAGVESSNPRYFKRLKFIRELKKLRADYILIDQSPGVSYMNIDLFLACDESIIVTQPEPDSFSDAFDFIRSALLRQLKKKLRSEAYALKQLEELSNWDWRKYEQSIRSVLLAVERDNPAAGQIFRDVLKTFNPQMVMNMVYDEAEVNEATIFAEKIKKLLLINTRFLGYIDFQKDFRRTLKKSRPLVLTADENGHADGSNIGSGSWLGRTKRAVGRIFEPHRQSPMLGQSMIANGDAFRGRDESHSDKDGSRIMIKIPSAA